MAWIELHQGLGTHVKTRRLCKLLGIGPAQAVGHLALLWTWALNAAENGSLAKYQADDLALVCEWDGDAAAFVAALERAGFLDLHHGELVIHNWDTYIGKLLEARERFRLLANERKKKQRERVNAIKHGEHVTHESRDCHADVTRESRTCHAHVTRDTSVSHAPVTPGHALTKPNLTKHVDTHVCSDAGTHDETPPTQTTEKPKRNQYPADFEAFWKAYPPRRRSEKPDAFNAWGKTIRTYTVAQIMASLEAMKRSPDWTKDGGEYVPMPGRWLRRLDPDDVLKDPEAQTEDVPEPFRGKPWVFHYVKAAGSKPELRVATMVHAWGFDYDTLVKHVEELGSYSKAADELWRQHIEKEAAHASAAF